MEDEINAEDPELILNYVKCMDQYLQNGKDGDVDLTARQHTGANLADITMNRVLQGIVTKDENRIRKAVSDMMTVYEVIDPNNIKIIIQMVFMKMGHLFSIIELPIQVLMVLCCYNEFHNL